MKRTLVGIAVSLIALTAAAETATVMGRTAEVQTAPAPNTFGTATATYEVITSFAALPFQSGTTYTGLGQKRWATGGSAEFVAPFALPNGSQIVGFEADLCDTNASAGASAYFLGFDKANNFFAFYGVSTSNADVAGCRTVSMDLSGAGLFVDNANQYYSIDFQHGALDGTTSFMAARVAYKLRVSPGPATATFADVPTSSPIYKFVEALYSAGITGGCGGGNYCPNAYVTRGQMAVFISSALGLHWPN